MGFIVLVFSFRVSNAVFLRSARLTCPGIKCLSFGAVGVGVVRTFPLSPLDLAFKVCFCFSARSFSFSGVFFWGVSSSRAAPLQGLFFCRSRVLHLLVFRCTPCAASWTRHSLPTVRGGQRLARPSWAASRVPSVCARSLAGFRQPSVTCARSL